MTPLQTWMHQWQPCSDNSRRRLRLVPSCVRRATWEALASGRAENEGRRKIGKRKTASEHELIWQARRAGRPRNIPTYRRARQCVIVKPERVAAASKGTGGRRMQSAALPIPGQGELRSCVGLPNLLDYKGTHKPSERQMCDRHAPC